MSRTPLHDVLISVVLPVYNEGEVLEELHRRVHRAVELCGTQQEIIFVNDGSGDSSAEILDDLAERFAHVRVVHLSRNFGHQAAVQAGLEHATGDAVILMDSDLQDAPEAIGRLVSEWSTGYDVVYAVRRDRPEALWKRALFSTFHRMLSRLAAPRIPVDAGNFSILDARVVREIVALGEHDRYLPGLRSWVGFRQHGIEIRRAPRYDGKPRVSLYGLWRLAKTAIFSFSSFPLMLFYFIGYSSLALFVLLGSFAMFCKLFTSLSVPGWTSNMLVGSFFGAVNALGISILGEYVIRIYDQVRGRPLYLVERTRNFERMATSPQLSIPWEPIAEPSVADEFQDLLNEAETLMSMASMARPKDEPKKPSVARTADPTGRKERRAASSGSAHKVGQGQRKSGEGKGKKRRGH